MHDSISLELPVPQANASNENARESISVLTGQSFQTSKSKRSHICVVFTCSAVVSATGSTSPVGAAGLLSSTSRWWKKGIKRSEEDMGDSGFAPEAARRAALIRHSTACAHVAQRAGSLSPVASCWKIANALSTPGGDLISSVRLDLLCRLSTCITNAALSTHRFVNLQISKRAGSPRRCALTKVVVEDTAS